MERLGLRVSEVAEALDVSSSWVYDRIERGELAHVKLRPGKGAVRIRPEDLKRFVDERVVAA